MPENLVFYFMEDLNTVVTEPNKWVSYMDISLKLTMNNSVDCESLVHVSFHLM